MSTRKIIIEITEEQHLELTQHIARSKKIDLEEETFSGFEIKLCCCIGADWLEVDAYGKLNLGDVNWRLE
jgi:hypothetical protein